MAYAFMKSTAVGLAAVVACLSARPAAAGPSGEDPERLISQGVELRRLGDDARAHGYFMRAYQIAHTPRSAAQLGLVELAVEEYLDAEEHLSEALASNDPWVRANRATVERARTTSREHLARIEISGAPNDASVQVGRRSPVPLPADGVVWAPVGETTLRVEAAGHEPVTRSVTVAAPGNTRLRIQMPAERATSLAAAPSEESESGTPSLTKPSPGPESPRSTTPGRPYRLAGLGSMGLGLAAGVTGFILRGVATTKLQSIQSAGVAVPARPYSDADGDWKTYDHLGVGLLIGGAVAVVAGAGLDLLGRRRNAEEDGPRIALLLVPGGLSGVQVGGRF